MHPQQRGHRAAGHRPRGSPALAALQPLPCSCGLGLGPELSGSLEAIAAGWHLKEVTPSGDLREVANWALLWPRR